MKLLKRIILIAIVGISLASHFSTMALYDLFYWLLLSLLLVIGFWFNWNYSTGCWPNMTLLDACCCAWALAAIGIYIVAVSFAEEYSQPTNYMIGLIWRNTPGVFLNPLISAPLSLLLWRWLFKEEREARIEENRKVSVDAI